MIATETKVNADTFTRIFDSPSLYRFAPEKVLFYLEEMAKKHQLLPNAEHYDIILEGLRDYKKTLQTLEVLEVMKSSKTPWTRKKHPNVSGTDSRTYYSWKKTVYVGSI